MKSKLSSVRPLQALCEGKKDFRLEVNGKSYSYLLDVELANLSGQINEALSIARSRAASFDPNHSWIKDLLAARDLTDALSVDPSIAETVSQQLRNRSHVTMPDVDPATTFRLE